MPHTGNAAFFRIFMIHAVLQEGRKCTAASLGRDLEVSDRTIRRTIEFMKDRMGAPIEWEPSTKTFFYSKPFEKLSHITLNSYEALALLLAEQALGPLRGLPIANALHAIFEKISQTVGDEVRHSWESLAAAVRTTDTSTAMERECEHFRTVLEAIQKQQVLTIHYSKPGQSGGTLRQVHPLHLVERSHRWTLVAFDPEVPGVRKFLLARMVQCTIEPSGFTPPGNFNIDTYLKGSMGLFTGDTIHKVEVDFSPYAAAYLRDSPWHPSQDLHQLPNGDFRATFQLNNLIDIQRNVLSWGIHAVVRNPPELVAEFSKISRHFQKKYRKSNNPDNS